ncbi:MAG: carboxypeptidase regulatory-like domain-containing protein [Candidatus Zhuqueibacterota bacterium]
MRRCIIFFVVLLFVPAVVLGITNAKLNGQKSIQVTQFPAEFVFTGDLARAGNSLIIEYFLDIDGDGQINFQEPTFGFNIITDGIGWIRDPNAPENDLPGDETGVDGKITTTVTFDMEEVLVPTGMTGIFRMTDEDGSTDQVQFTILAEYQPPFIMGRVTDQTTGNPIQNVIVTAESTGETRGAISDANGDYKIAVIPGNWKVVAYEIVPNHQPSDTVNVTVTGAENQTVDISLALFPCFVEGQLATEEGTPVPGVFIYAGSDEMTDFFSYSMSNAQGQYRIGVMPGTVYIVVSYLANAGFNQGFPWPTDSYVEPETDTLTISENETLTSNFVFKKYTSFITGKCTIDGAGLAGVTVNGMAMDFTTFELNFYQTLSDDNGDYRLGVKPGVLTMLQATKDGYTLTTPAFGYQQVAVGENQTVTGKDFDFDVDAGVTSVSGAVSYASGAPAADVYVVAVNDNELNAQGYLISYTDGAGNYSFENIPEGYWQIGVYQANYHSTPAMLYLDIFTGMQQTGQNFILSEGSAVSDMDPSTLPETIELIQNYPNPFNPSTQISFALPRPMEVRLTIFNARGQFIRTLIDGHMDAGLHQISWDGRSDAGARVTSGVYFYRLKTAEADQVRKMILAR